MHLNRKKIKQNKFKISPRGAKKKKIKIASEKKIIRPIVKSKRRNKKLKITSVSGVNSLDVKKFGDKSEYKLIKEWKNILDGEVVFILGNAPSISKQNLSILKPYFTIGVNRIFYVYTPTILMWQDIEMWNSEKNKIANSKSLRICNKLSDPRSVFLNFKVKAGNFKFGCDPSILHGTGNTTALAAQLAINMGCSSMVLLGTDCKYQNGKTDFYGNNKDHKSYTLKMCDTAMKWIKDNSPVPIYNCSINKLWPQENLVDVINRLRPLKSNRKKYLEKFKK